jgi:kinesin family protein C1
MNDQLREETLSKMEMEASKYDAVAAMEVAQEKARLATTKLHEMGDLIESSRHLQKNNEALNVSLQKETERRKALHNTIEDMKGRIRVYVRIRPFSESETNSDCTNVMTKEDDRTIAMAADASAGIEARAWEFDKIFCGTSAEGNTQEAVFKDTSLLITSAIDGFNVCIFAYGKFVVLSYYLHAALDNILIFLSILDNSSGQTGSGKVSTFFRLHFFLVVKDDLLITQGTNTHLLSLPPR